ncbi:calcium-activated chloride channel regulator 4A-like isoform X2 [Hyperolius riggenbachi]|uniref:calcium-activated chloride channel regulator 4A-like isoform X2 n=1 Tax=Hyperolius riggenbachi TaxID=752182 RepID=UPI0035A2D164
MALRNILVLFLVFGALSANKNSMVKLNDGGYEDIVIAINPALKEDPQIIENIKADIKIDNPSQNYGDDPYTKQYGGCGEQGEYIHFTPNFITNDSLISVYGPRGRVFVHEWAHLRWGVFDEYSLDDPFYIASNLKVEATRCSADIFGLPRITRCTGNSCTVTPCNFDSNTGLYEKGCVFVPDQSQFVTESIMFMQALPDVTEFCDASNHNIEAPNPQNRICNYRSTWDVIMDSSDISSSPSQPSLTIPEPTFTLLQYSERVLTLVLDVSGSMGWYNRIERLYQAAEVFLIQIIETNSNIGMVQFADSDFVLSQLLQIRSDAERQQLKQLLPTTANGGTNICSGILAGIEVNKGKSGSSHGTEIVLLSDGEDNYHGTLCYPDIINSGAIIHVIFLGLAEPTLEELSKATGGLTFLATDNVDANGLIDAFSAISSGNGDITQQSIQLESTNSILVPQECLNGTVFIDSTVGNDTFFLVTWQTRVPGIYLEEPTGRIYTAAHFDSDTTSKSSRLAINGTAARGAWIYSLCNGLLAAEAIGIVVNSKAADENVLPIIVNAHMSQDTNQYPNPMVIYASVSQGLVPVVGAKVTAMIEPVSGPIMTVDLLDNGAGADIQRDDGIYSKYFIQFLTNGRYGLKVRVESNNGKSRLIAPKSRALYIPGFIINGSISMNPPQPEINNEDLILGDFSRTASGGSFVLTNVPTDVPLDIYKPEKITDLKAQIQDDSIVLSWTATGDDLDEGTASEYDLRMNTNLKELRDNFTGSSQVNMTGVIPKSAGSLESFTFVPENVAITNGTILYFGLVAVDDVSLKSDVSNIAQAALFIPPPADPTTVPPSTQTEPTTTPNNSEKMKASVISAIAYSVAVLICIYVPS